MTHDVFICHSSKDRTIANAICSKLEQNHIRCWIAPRDVIPGSDYAESIIEAISGTKLTVLVFSDNSNQSPHVHREIERTVGHGIPILPFRVDDVIPSPSLEYFISNAHWLDAITPPMEQHLDHLVGTVRLLLERAGDEVPAPVPAPEATPQPPAPHSSPLPSWWRWAAVGAVALVVAVVAGVLVLGGGGGDHPAALAPSASPSDSVSEPPVSVTAARKLGTSIALTGIDAGSKATVTAMNIVDPTTSADDTPAAGNRFVAVQFTIRNTGTLVYDDSPDNCASLVDASGREIEDTTVYSIAAGQMFEATITMNPGQQATGYVVFDVPKAFRVSTIHFTMDSGYADQTGVWKVG